jgi:hypothetical protein
MVGSRTAIIGGLEEGSRVLGNRISLVRTLGSEMQRATNERRVVSLDAS